MACIDLGSSVVAVAIAAADGSGPPIVLGRGWAPAAGLERGDIVDLTAAGRAVAAALEAAERAAGCHAGQALLAIGGRDLRGTLRRGRLTLGREPARVTRRHATRAVHSVLAASSEPDQEVLHVIPRRFWLDGRQMVRNPLGMAAARLDVETHVITGSSAAIRNAVRCVQDQGLDVRELVCAPLAAGEAVLTRQERDAGVVLLDLGTGTTGAVVYTQGTPVVTTSVPMGGRHVTGDVAMVLRVSLTQAERLKVSYGRAGAGDLPDRLLDVPDDEGIGGEPVSHRLLCEVIEARLEEVFEQVMGAIAATDFAEPLPAGVVLSGGGAALPDADAVARRCFALPARVGAVQSPFAPDAALAPGWATVVGLLTWLQRGQPELLPEGNKAVRTGPGLGRLFRLLRPLGGE